MPNLLLTMWDTIKSSNIGILAAAGLGMFAIIGGLSMLSYHYTLSGIKSRTVGDGQHGTAGDPQDLCPRAVQGQRLAQGSKSSHRTGSGAGLQG